MVFPENVHIKNKDQLLLKFEKIRLDGSSNLQIISDFDRTLTYEFINGVRASSSPAILRDNGYMGEDYVKKAHELFDKYYPYENDINLDLKEKSEKMWEWWTIHMKLMVESGISKNIFDDIAFKNLVPMRGGFKEFFEIFSLKNIPLLIFSAGLGDIILSFLEKHNLVTPNVHLVSNFFKFGNDGKALDFDESMVIHSLNKNEFAIKNTSYYEVVKSRKNVILLGDKPSDLGMKEGIEHEESITICFLNDKIDELLENYLDQFDVVITGDSDLSFVNNLICEIV